MKFVIKKDAEKLCAIMMKAVNARDSKKILQLAAAVERVRRGNGSSDIYRGRILVLRVSMEAAHKRMPLCKVAEIIKWPRLDDIDSLRHLRRLCKELGFPLEQVRKSKSS